MGLIFEKWNNLSGKTFRSTQEVVSEILRNRGFEPIEKLDYGDHGLLVIVEKIVDAIRNNHRIALYADYDVDGTMSCVSWIWFFNAIGFKNFRHYIPCRFREGYGVNLEAIKKLIHEDGAQVIITMDTGITANQEASYAREHNVLFICTDHHKIQPEKIPDGFILNPKMNPNEQYQELCGCGVTYVLLRKLAPHFPEIKPQLWTDLLCLVGMATICDVVPLNPVNHQLARLGVQALSKTKRPILRKLLAAADVEGTDEQDVGFRLGPRINAVGRLEHADAVIEAFITENPDDLIRLMGRCNDERKKIQDRIIQEALKNFSSILKSDENTPIVFLGGDWHPGVVGIAASRTAETFWRPTWLFQIKDGICKGSARSIPGFDVTEAMTACGDLFMKFGGHAAAGGFSFEVEKLDLIRERLSDFANNHRTLNSEKWKPAVDFDGFLNSDVIGFETLNRLETLKPFGMGFREPKFVISGKISKLDYLKDKITGAPKHTALWLEDGATRKVMFFNRVVKSNQIGDEIECLVTMSKNVFRGQTNINLIGVDLNGKA